MNFKMMPLLTYAVYIVLLVLLVWGGKIATKKKHLMDFMMTL